MMCKKTSSRWAATKALLVVPMVAVALSAFATTVYVPRELQDKVTENSVNLQDEEKPNPLVVVDGKIIAYDEMNQLDPNTIGNMSVFKGDKAKEYADELDLNISAEDVKEGLIVITLKKDGESTSSAEATKGKIVIADNKSANTRESVRQALQMNLQPVAGLYGAISAKITVKPDGTVGKFSVDRASGEYTKQDLGPLVGKVLSAIPSVSGKFTPPAETTTYNYDISFCIKDGDKTLASEAYLAEDAIVVLSYADSAKSDSAAKANENTPYIKVEKMPTFRGGNLTLFQNWMQNNVKYPAEAIEKGISGRVVFSFVVEADGSLSSYQLMASPDKILADEVERVFNSSPREWTAGEQDGKKVKVKFTLPIVFAAVSNAPESASDEAFIKVDKMPKFRGGDLMLFQNWMQNNVQYPAEAIEKGISGRVVFSFVVEADGSLSSYQLMALPDKILADEVERVFNSSPREWTAGEQDGKKVRVKFTVPVAFMVQGAPKK